MLLRRLRILLFRSVKAFYDDSCTQRAAALSYYVLFSLFPLLIVSVAIIGFFLQDETLQQDIVNEIMDNIPLSQNEGRDDVTDALQHVASDQKGAIGLVGLLGLAWAGSALFGVLRSSLNAVFHFEHTRTMLVRKLYDLGIALSFTPFFILSIAATSTLRIARRASEDVPIFGAAAEEFGFGWDIASFLMPVLISFVAFFLVYWLVPARRLQPRYIAAGAALAAVLFEIVKVGFSVYLENLVNYDVVFGSLGAVVAFLFWVFLSANTMLLGAEVTSQLPAVVSGLYDPPPRPRGPRRPVVERVLGMARGLVIRPSQQETPREDTAASAEDGAGKPA
ncbi:MAG TPA: YihY/virulence factor BrkB family protein [Dehalococcoidia bacterium]|nr:YihY/virulence factor BrkB family protein [Dehalococcoidia bacterium]